MNNLIHPEHRSAVLALNTIQASIIWGNLCGRDPTFPHPEPDRDPPSPADLLNALDEHPVDHLTLLLPTCRDARPEATQALEVLLGRPLTRTVPRAPRSSAGPRSSHQRTAPAVVDTRVVATVRPNPKKPGSASFTRYESWKVGETVQQAISRGLLRGDVTWDTERGFVTLGDPA